MVTTTTPQSSSTTAPDPVRWEGVEHRTSWLIEVTPDVYCVTTYIVNLFMVGQPGGPWVLIDAGIPGCDRIRAAADRLYGGRPPEAIIMTHGHFDHVGCLKQLAEEWDVPVYAHRQELPFLTGRSDYPPADPTVGGGMMARTGPLYPRRAIDLGNRVRELPPDGSVPHLPGWRWIHTPGHTPGHVSFFRDADRVLIAGDAFITTKQESAYAVATQTKVIHGPPMYFTIDWDASRASVRHLASLNPYIAATGHGIPMGGDRLAGDLRRLAEDFDRIARPRKGRYVRDPARWDANGAITYVPPRPFDSTLWIAAGIGLALLLGIGASTRDRG